jgi:GntR family transcriptional regulator/MocR family aminotransferase
MQIAGARVTAAPVDAEGMLVDRVSPRARVVCVTPSHQFPLGYPMSLARRVALLRFARQHHATVIEDDYDGEYRFGGGPLDALKTLDRDERVFYVGTFSKSLFPALRLGYIVAPSWARPALIAAKALVDRHCCIESQDTLAVFIAEGHLARHVRKMTRIYAERRAALLAALARHCGSLVVPMHSVAGLHVSATLRVQVSAQTILESAERRGMKLQAISRFSSAKRPVNAIGFGYGAIATQDIDAGVALFADMIGGTRTPARVR